MRRRPRHPVATGGGLVPNSTTAVAIDPQNPFVAYAGTDGGGVFRTSDGGESWRFVSRWA